MLICPTSFAICTLCAKDWLCRSEHTLNSICRNGLIILKTKNVNDVNIFIAVSFLKAKKKQLLASIESEHPTTSTSLEPDFDAEMVAFQVGQLNGQQSFLVWWH
jgi:hypothetical protein